MSQFNLYLERIQETRNYKYQDLELYDEGFKEIWDKMKDKLKSFGRYATIIGLLLSAGNFDSLKKDSIPEELKDAKSVLLKMIQNPKKTLSESDRKNLDTAIKFYNTEYSYYGKDGYVFDSKELINWIEKYTKNAEQVKQIVDFMSKQESERNLEPDIYNLLRSGPNDKGL
jgi:hypothetical protein